MRQSTGPIGMSKGALRTCGVLLGKYLLFQDHNYVCKVLINSKKKKGMLCNLFVEHCMIPMLAQELEKIDEEMHE